jgi:hypothetical protein
VMRIIVGIVFAVGSVALAGCCLWRQATGELEPLPPSPIPRMRQPHPHNMRRGHMHLCHILETNRMHQRHPQTHNMKTEEDMKTEGDEESSSRCRQARCQHV